MPRLVFVDLLRGWAVIVMIETHVFNALMVTELRNTWWFDIVNFVNGLVAPSFLFVSGFVFVLSTRRKIEEYRKFGGAFWKQIGRVAVIWIVAYVLHLPSFSYARMAQGVNAEAWLKFFQADILHCIVAGWLLLLCGFMIVRSDSAARRLMATGAAVCVFVTPFIWEIDFLQFLPASVAAYMNGQHYSLFPVFPWLGFMFAGSSVALSYLDAAARDLENVFVRHLLLFSVILVVVSALSFLISARLPFASRALAADPLFFFLRLGIVLLLLAACWHYVRMRGTERSVMLEVSRESFLVYTVHLLLIYGNYIGDKSTVDLYGTSWDAAESAAGSLVLVALMIGLAKAWGLLKRKSPGASRVLSYGVAVVAAILFFLRDS